MTSLPSVSDPLRSRAIYQVTDYSRIRSPVAKPTMAGLTTTEAVPFATAGIAGSPLMGLSPTPKPTMVRDLMPPPPPVLPQAGHKAVTPHKTLAVGRTLGPTNSEPPDRQASEEAGEHVAADDSPREAQVSSSSSWVHAAPDCMDIKPHSQVIIKPLVTLLSAI
eukprot:scaffold25879_cov28-Tisochrysis_lutea.AAC.1